MVNSIMVKGFEDIFNVASKKPLTLEEIAKNIFEASKVNKKDSKDKYGLVPEDYGFIIDGVEDVFITEKELKPGIILALRAKNN